MLPSCGVCIFETKCFEREANKHFDVSTQVVFTRATFTLQR